MKNMASNGKGIVVTVNLLVTIVFVILAALIIFFLWGSFASEAGRPSSAIFYNFLDWVVNFIS